MAHIEKYQGSAIGKLCGHYNRWADFPGHGVERDNIDPSRTPENYNLGPERDITDVGFIQRRIGELDLRRAPRKDAVRMIDTVVTLPGSYRGDTREFFEAVKDTLDGIFGAENCVSAWVHMDERTPHMHYASVPVTVDGRLSAKSLLTRTFMRKFHDRLEAGVCERLGIERAGLTLTDEQREQRAGKYVDLPEYKAAQDAVRRKERRSMELNAEIADKEGDLIELDSAIEDRRFELQDLGEQIRQETQRLESVRRAIEEKQLEPAPEKLSGSLRALWEARGDGVREEQLAGEIEGLRGRVSELERDNRRARERVPELERRRDGLAGRVEYLRGSLARARERFERLAGRVRGCVENVGERMAGVLRSLGVDAHAGGRPLEPGRADGVSLAGEAAAMRAAARGQVSGRGRGVSHGER